VGTTTYKPSSADYSQVFQTLHPPPQLDLADLEPEQILDSQLSKKGNSIITQLLIKWTQLPQEMATWEDHNVLKQRYSEAPIWRPTDSQGEDNVMTGANSVTTQVTQ
jgi:hypothetical protein